MIDALSLDGGVVRCAAMMSFQCNTTDRAHKNKSAAPSRNLWALSCQMPNSSFIVQILFSCPSNFLSLVTQYILVLRLLLLASSFFPAILTTLTLTLCLTLFLSFFFLFCPLFSFCCLVHVLAVSLPFLANPVAAAGSGARLAGIWFDTK